MRTSQRTGVSTFASPASPSTDQSLQKSFHLSHPDKIELKKNSFPSENKKYPTAQPDTTKTVKRSIDNGLKGRWTEGQLITRVWQKWRFSAPQTHFLVKQSLVLRINICGENRHLRQARNRYKKPLSYTESIKKDNLWE